MGNFIGTDVTGTKALGNRADGVAIDGASGNSVGGTASGDGNVISGNLGSGVSISNSGSANSVVNNFIGTDFTGTVALGNNANGVAIVGASNNTVGGTTNAARNIISGNTLDGVLINSTASQGSSGNVLEGNDIGTDVNGTKALGNGTGVAIVASSNNTVGSTTGALGNVISGNTAGGVLITGTSGTAANNVVVGNFIGTDATGMVALGNSGDGVAIVDASANTIGGTNTSLGNVISDNSGNGVSITATMTSMSATNNLVAANMIGTDETGAVALGNHGNGVLIQDASGNTIGAVSLLGAGNVISANQGHGVVIESTGVAAAQNNVLVANLIGTNGAGTNALGNQQDGVGILDASNNTIGGTAAARVGNVISGNLADGIRITSDGTAAAMGNLLVGNAIGVDSTVSLALGNLENGVEIDDASQNDVGSPSTGGNLISGNQGDGVLIKSTTSAAAAHTNTIAGNRIGTNGAGTAALGNLMNGLVIQDSSGNSVGGPTMGSIDVVSGNKGNGIVIQSTGVAAATANVVFGNAIGTNSAQSAAVGNLGDGVLILGASGNIIGGQLQNVISGNMGDGVGITGSVTAAATNNQVLANFIGTDSFGEKAIPSANGVDMIDASGNTVGGTASGSANVISGNAMDGIFLQSDGAAPTSSNLIAGNSIGTDVNGTLALGNGADGVGLDDAVGNTIGGAGTARNVISANKGRGVDLQSGSNNNAVQGNLIGTIAPACSRHGACSGSRSPARPGAIGGGRHGQLDLGQYRGRRGYLRR